MELEGPFCWEEVFVASEVDSVVICAWGWAFLEWDGGGESLCWSRHCAVVSRVYWGMGLYLLSDSSRYCSLVQRQLGSVGWSEGARG